MNVDVRNLDLVKDILSRAAQIAATDPEYAEQLRDSMAESGIFSVFGVGETLDVVDLLDAGGEDTLRARLRQMKLSELRQIVAVRNYDPEKETIRWRSPNKYIELIIMKAQEQLEEELARQSPSGASWML